MFGTRCSVVEPYYLSGKKKTEGKGKGKGKEREKEREKRGGRKRRVGRTHMIHTCITPTWYTWYIQR
jgi:hypothetical protein